MKGARTKSGRRPVKLPPYEAQPVLIKSGKNTDWSHDFYNIKELHSRGKRGSGVKVAVLDTGVDLQHRSFAKAVAEGRLHALTSKGVPTKRVDKNGHGTWCVSRYVSDDNEVLGFAPDCTVYSYEVLGAGGSGTLMDIKTAALHAIDQGVHIISTSLGWSGSHWKPFDEVIQKAEDAGIVFVSAAGNDGTKEDIDYPALYGSVISIGSHGKTGRKDQFSDWGMDSDIYGSGSQVKGAWLNNTEAILNGTSMATPSVGALTATLYDDLIREYGGIDRETYKKIVSCQGL